MKSYGTYMEQDQGYSIKTWFFLSMIAGIIHFFVVPLYFIYICLGSMIYLAIKILLTGDNDVRL